MTASPRMPSPVRNCLLGTAVALALSACGNNADTPAATAADAATDATSAPAVAAPPAQAQALTFADGPDVCFRAVADALDPATPVSEITSAFDDEGRLEVCTVDYQNPADERKLVGQRLDPATGTFGEPYDIELSVSGDAASFRLADYLVPLSQVDAAALAETIEGLKPSLEPVYSSYRWTRVRLESPGPFSEVHTLRLDLDGRLAANDVKNSGYASVSLDGRQVVRNHLLP